MNIRPVDFNPPGDDAPAILPPNAASLFAERAQRFAALAEGHSLADWLRFLGQLTHAQHAALRDLPELALPSEATRSQAREHGMPPLGVASLNRPPIWREVLRQLIDALAPQAPASSRDRLAALRAASDERLEQLAKALLENAPDPGDAGELPLVAAALQVVWTALAGRLSAGELRLLEPSGLCPCCGSLPVASIVRLSAGVNNLRYLHCSLCNTEWNVPRATCTGCGGDHGLALQQIDGTDGAMRAETCDSCRSYLKIAWQEKDPRVDPVADDLATLALDLLVDEAGYARSGPNMLLTNTAT